MSDGGEWGWGGMSDLLVDAVDEFYGVEDAAAEGSGEDEVELLGPGPVLFDVVDFEGAVWWHAITVSISRHSFRRLGIGEAHKSGCTGLMSTPMTSASGFCSAARNIVMSPKSKRVAAVKRTILQSPDSSACSQVEHSVGAIHFGAGTQVTAKCPHEQLMLQVQAILLDL